MLADRHSHTDRLRPAVTHGGGSGTATSALGLLQALHVAGLAVRARRLGMARAVATEDVALVDGFIIVALCGSGVSSDARRWFRGKSSLPS